MIDKLKSVYSLAISLWRDNSRRQDATDATNKLFQVLVRRRADAPYLNETLKLAEQEPIIAFESFMANVEEFDIELTGEEWEIVQFVNQLLDSD